MLASTPQRLLASSPLPLSLPAANLAEALAYWAGSPDGSEIATMLDCFARYNHTYVLKPEAQRRMKMDNGAAKTVDVGTI